MLSLTRPFFGTIFDTAQLIKKYLGPSHSYAWNLYWQIYSRLRLSRIVMCEGNIVKKKLFRWTTLQESHQQWGKGPNSPQGKLPQQDTIAQVALIPTTFRFSMALNANSFSGSMTMANQMVVPPQRVTPVRKGKS